MNAGAPGAAGAAGAPGVVGERAPPAENKPYINPFFAQKEMFKAKDNILKANPKSPLTLIKPLRPNILDAAANERQKELADQRKRAGHKWVVVTQR
jgi:hypothetical protein